MKEESGLYAGIENPVDFRRSLLEASKSVIKGLQRYEGLSSLREKKFKEMERYKELTNEIGRLIKQLKAELPTFNLRNLPKRPLMAGATDLRKETIAAVQERPEKQIRVPMHRKLTEVERLEDELNAIEDKLKAL